MRNLHLTFDYSTYNQMLGEDFAKLCGLLRIYELYHTEEKLDRKFIQLYSSVCETILLVIESRGIVHKKPSIIDRPACIYISTFCIFRIFDTLVIILTSEARDLIPETQTENFLKI